jgi:hypothetical protein
MESNLLTQKAEIEVASAPTNPVYDGRLADRLSWSLQGQGHSLAVPGPCAPHNLTAARGEVASSRRTFPRNVESVTYALH